MVNTGYGQLLANGDWTADVVYIVTSRTIGSYQQHQVRLSPRRGRVDKPSSRQTLDLICANGVRYRVRGEFAPGAGGAYVADLIPLPVGVEFA